MIDGTFEVVEDSLDNSPMNVNRRMQKLAELVDCKGDVWSGKGAILQSTH
jgi:hypothetical protein